MSTSTQHLHEHLLQENPPLPGSELCLWLRLSLDKLASVGGVRQVEEQVEALDQGGGDRGGGHHLTRMIDMRTRKMEREGGTSDHLSQGDQQGDEDEQQHDEEGKR